MDKFLSLWDNHNIAIIEGLVALVILFSLLLAYRSFFAKSAQGHDGDAGQGLDAAQLEKTLQKILDNQAAGKSKGTEDLSLDIAEESESSSAKPAVGAGADAAEVAKLKAAVSEGQQKIQELQKQVKEAQAAAEASAAAAATVAPAGGGEGAGGISAKEKEDLLGKIRDLEARLAEYEIISEDIADLSRYREENDNLKKEIETLKAGVPAAAPAAPPADPVAVSAPAAEEPVAPAAPAESSPEAAPEPVLEVAASGVAAAPMDAELEAAVAAMADQAVEAPAAEVAEAPAVEAAPAPASPDESVIDDDLMKEFAAAVQGQKDLSAAAGKAGDGKAAAKKADAESDKLMNEFENFVTKKS
ncbi:MAG: hypothetical protein HUU57_03075 [Bdellovibrio sp.]|nr:hypothetical protein [Bdellovibrio sp.]